MRPYYLDGDLAQHDLDAPHAAYAAQAGRLGLAGPGDTRFSAAAYRWRLIVASVQFSRTVERRIRRPIATHVGHVVL
jgi:hypothetical protein